MAPSETMDHWGNQGFRVKIAFVIQNLAQASDSVGFDCIYQYRIARDHHPEPGAVRVFANVFVDDLYPDIRIEPVQNFWDAVGQFPDVTIIYHFCDGWPVMDAFLRDQARNAIIRWHNNTPLGSMLWTISTSPRTVTGALTSSPGLRRVRACGSW